MNGKMTKNLKFISALVAAYDMKQGRKANALFNFSVIKKAHKKGVVKFKSDITLSDALLKFCIATGRDDFSSMYIEIIRDYKDEIEEALKLK